MGWTIDRSVVFGGANGTPRYELIASAIEAAVDRGDLRPGERLPTVRALARELGVSSASVAVAYRLLERHGRADAQVGRGTFVRAFVAGSGHPSSTSQHHAPSDAMPRRADVTPVSLATSWRRRSLYFGDRLRAMNPHALVCNNSWPDPALMPVEVLKRAFSSAASDLTPTDLQYSGPEAQTDLVRALLPRLEADGVPAEATHIVIVNSLIQTLSLTLHVAPAVIGSTLLTVAVEEPGFHAAYNLIENLGHGRLGIACDAEGALPEGLRVALERGANLVLLTPRALNPTGASWTSARRTALANVLAEFPRVLIVEDDHFSGLTSNRPGSLLQHPKLAERTVHARSFSKALAPDLRTTALVVSGQLGTLLRDARLNAGGWSSRLSQKALAHALEDPSLDEALSLARDEYAARRSALLEGLAAHVPAGSLVPPRDGLNVWLRLPPGSEAVHVMQHAAQLGVIVASGETFHLEPGHREALRASVGHVTPDEAREAGNLLGTAMLTVDDMPLPLVV